MCIPIRPGTARRLGIDLPEVPPPSPFSGVDLATAGANLAHAAARLRDFRFPVIRVGHIPQDPDDTTH